MNKRAVTLVAGGTGGHLYPASVLAHHLHRRGHPLTLITDERGYRYSGDIKPVVGTGGIHIINWRPGRGVSGFLATLGLFIKAFGTCRGLLKTLRPDVVVGFGGYACLPTVLAARFLQIPTLIHEQNAVFGRANRLLAPVVRGIATSFNPVRKLKNTYKKKTRWVGMPVRTGFLEMSPYTPPRSGEALSILCVGGSQGTQAFATLIPRAIGLLDEKSRRRLTVHQQCRADDTQPVTSAYTDMGVACHVSEFFEDMAEHVRRAHVVIARAGASTVCELALAGRPAIFIPYPHATDDHQTANAGMRPSAPIVPQDEHAPRKLASLLATYLAQPALLAKAAAEQGTGAIKDGGASLSAMTLEIADAGGMSSPTPSRRLA